MTNPPTDERREAFERWIDESGFDLTHGEDRDYVKETTDAAWGGWQAALSHQGEVVAVDALQGLCDEWENIKVPHSASSYELGEFDGYRGARHDLTALISKAEKV